MNNYHNFSNGVTIVNATPHPIRFQDVNGEVITIDSDPEYVINARVEESVWMQYGIAYATPTFVGTDEGEQIIELINAHFSEPPIVVGSIIAAQAYPGRVCGMCPVPGHERVAPAEKLMRVDKFTRY